MDIFVDSIRLKLFQEFFPYTSETELQEKLEQNGYQISNVKKEKGGIIFEANNEKFLLNRLIIGITPRTKKMTILGMTSFTERSVLKANIIIASDLENGIPLSIEKLHGSDFISRRVLRLFNSQSNHFYNSELFNSELIEDPFVLSAFGSFRYLSRIVSNSPYKFFVFGLRNLLKNIHCEKMPLISELSVIKKNKLKKEILEKIILKSLNFQGSMDCSNFKLLFTIGLSFLGIEIYPMLLKKIRYDAIEFSLFFEEIKETFYFDVLHFLNTEIKSLSLSTDEGSLKVNILFAKIFPHLNSETVRPDLEKMFLIKVNSFLFDNFIRYMETSNRNLFENNATLFPIVRLDYCPYFNNAPNCVVSHNDLCIPLIQYNTSLAEYCIVNMSEVLRASSRYISNEYYFSNNHVIHDDDIPF